MDQNDNNKNWSGKSRGGLLGYLTFIKLIKGFGVRSAYIFLAFVTVYFVFFAPKATRSVWMYSRKILHKNRISSFFFLYRNYYSFGRALIDKVAVNQGKYGEYTFEFSEPENVTSILDSNQGVVIIGAHFGNWEVGAPFFDKYGKKMSVVMMDREYQGIKRILETQKSVDTFSVIPIKGNDFDYLYKIRDALDRGEYISIQGDRLSRSEKHRDIEFLGKSAAFPLGPFVLATRMNAPVVFYFAVHTGYKRYRFDFVLSDYMRSETNKKKEDELIREYVSVLEKKVTEFPEQWYNYYDFWHYER